MAINASTVKLGSAVTAELEQKTFPTHFLLLPDLCAGVMTLFTDSHCSCQFFAVGLGPLAASYEMASCCKSGPPSGPQSEPLQQ